MSLHVLWVHVPVFYASVSLNDPCVLVSLPQQPPPPPTQTEMTFYKLANDTTGITDSQTSVREVRHPPPPSDVQAFS